MKFKVRLRPREYQRRALEWALSRDGAVVCLPTGTGKTLIAVLWVKKLLEEGVARKVVVLEPTRILVEQVATYFSKVSDIPAKAIHGIYSKDVRKGMWGEAVVAVATPETALSDVDEVIKAGYDAVVIDECHHTTGKDAYAEFMRRTRGVFKRRLGLTAYIPPSRLGEIRDFIGEVRHWPWSDPLVKPYVPKWIGEVYEAELNRAEEDLLKKLEEFRNELAGRERGLVQTAIRWFVRDGALALRESTEKATKLASLLTNLKNLITDPRVRPAHKLDALKRVLADHEGFRKAIVFVDRVVIAKYIASKMQDLNPVVVCGKTHLSRNVKEVLREAKSEDTKLIVSTSAGEEGLDLPEGDLLVVWSNVASPLRFIQRHGRILRAVTQESPPKFVTYIITPNTVDTDSFVDSVEAAKKAGVDVPVSKDVIERLWRRTTRVKVLSIIEGRPMPVEWIREVLGLPEDIVKSSLRKLMEHGDVVYIYTHLGKTYITSADLDVLYDEYGEYLNPDEELEGKVRAHLSSGKVRSFIGNYSDVLERLRKVMTKHGPIKKIAVSLQVPLTGGALKLVNLTYSYLVDTKEKLELVLRNAYSVRELVRYL